MGSLADSIETEFQKALDSFSDSVESDSRASGAGLFDLFMDEVAEPKELLSGEEDPLFGSP
jgi:hypothetical protein